MFCFGNKGSTGIPELEKRGFQTTLRQREAKSFRFCSILSSLVIIFLENMLHLEVLVLHSWAYVKELSFQFTNRKGVRERGKKKGKEGGINRKRTHMARINWPEKIKQILNLKYYIIQMKLKTCLSRIGLTGSGLMWFSR